MALFNVARAQWGGGARPRPLTAVSHPYVEVHHTGVAAHATRDPLAVMREVEQYHLSRGWNGFFYGLMLARDGRIIEGRGIGWRSIGSHAATYRDGSRVDPRALTVVLPGDYRSVTLTDGQVKALHKVRAAVPDPILRVHGDRDSTACPGTHARHAVQLLNLDTSTHGGHLDMSQTERFMTDANGTIPPEFERGARAILSTNHHAQSIPTILARLNALTGQVKGIADTLSGGTPDDVIAYLEEHLATLADQIAAIDTSDGGAGSDLTPEQLVQLFADALLAGIGSRSA